MSANEWFDSHPVRLWVDEDGDWMAAIEDMPTVSAFGESPSEALRELACAWEGVKESYSKHGDPIPTPAKQHRVMA